MGVVYLKGAWSKFFARASRAIIYLSTPSTRGPVSAPDNIIRIVLYGSSVNTPNLYSYIFFTTMVSISGGSMQGGGFWKLVSMSLITMLLKVK